MFQHEVPPEVIDLADLVWRFAGEEPVQAQVALAWLAKNRSVAARKFAARHGRDHPVFGDGSVAAACRSIVSESIVFRWSGEEVVTAKKAAPSNENRKFSRAIAIAWGVLNGDYPDPTTNAIKFHRHDHSPLWSRQAEPSALIGAYFYYPAQSGDEVLNHG